MKQTESLLKNGYVTSRGKAYASGTAYAGVDTYFGEVGGVYKDWTGSLTPDSSTIKEIDENLSNAADASNDFEETLDWIDIRLEELDETLGLLEAELANAATYAEKNQKIDQIIAKNKEKMANLEAGANYYERYAEKFWHQIPAQYQKAAQNGAIAITDFIGDANEEVVEAIQKYRDYVQKAADLRQQKEEAKTENRNRAIERLENVKHTGDVRTAIEDAQTNKLQNAVDFDEERGLITDPNYYAAMMENASVSIKYWQEAKKQAKIEFDNAVAEGLKVGSDEWYEQLQVLYDIDAAIAEATISLEEFQNAINDIYWESFDELINRFDYISEDAQSLIDLMSSSDMVSKPDNENGWGADDVEWTDEGLATLGLHAQKMEQAEEKAKAYAVAIDDLTAEYEAGHYSESEYYEKLNELTQGQYEAIEAAQEEKEAIVELNEQRIDAIKEGIEKELEAYEKLIEKKKEELDAEKDLYDFQKSTMEQQKDIADIQRRLAALSGDNSASAVAKRKQLEAELAEAEASLQESYYDRSVENQQSALDKELENFQTEKDAEIEKLEEYLTNVEQVVADSLGIVQANATEIGNTLTTKAEEYNLTVSDAVLAPWKDGAVAIDEYTTKFGDSVSSTTEQLETIRAKWQEIKEELAAANAEADRYYNKGMAEADGKSVDKINADNKQYISATKKPEQAPQNGNNKAPEKAKATPSVGSSVIVKKSATHFSSKSGNAKMASFVPGGSYTVYQTSGDQILIGRNGVYTGWVKKTDLQGYAKGTLGVTESQLAMLDELGEELVMHAGSNGRLAFLSKGSSVIPHDITENLMELGQLDPSEVLNRNRPQIAPSKSVVNNNMEIHVDASVGELIHVDRLDGNNLDEITKVVDKAWDKKMQSLNNSIKKFTR